MPSIDPRQLNDLASFAQRGGLGKGIATTDCVAEEPDQLMFIKGDELILLRELPDCILASCEGVVGWVKKGEINFDSVAGSSSPVSISATEEIPPCDDLPRTVLTEPSPPTSTTELPPAENSLLDAPEPERSVKRVSGPFELESPGQSPRPDQDDSSFAAQQDKTNMEDKRVSIASVASSEAFGGIGGFMLGDSGRESLDIETTEELRDDVSPASASVNTPNSPDISPSRLHFEPSPARTASPASENSDWDIYGDYSRESMYGSLKRISQAAKRASKAHRNIYRDSTDSMIDQGAIHAAQAALEGVTSPLGEIASEGKKKPSPLVLVQDPKTPKAEDREPIKSPLETGFTGRSIATELRLRIQRQQETEVSAPTTDPDSVMPSIVQSEDGHAESIENADAPAPPARPPRREPRQKSPVGTGEDTKTLSDTSHGLGSDETSSTTHLATPRAPDTISFSAGEGSGLLASPMPFDEKPKLAEPLHIPSPSPSPLLAEAPFSPSVDLPAPPGWSPSLSAPAAAWAPSAPASPHSIAATRQAVEAVKKTPEGRRPRGLTLVGRMEADLSASKGPVPITFMIGGPEVIEHSPNRIGLGFPSGRNSPVTPSGRSRSPLASPIPPPPMPDDLGTLKMYPNKYPAPPQRSVTTPMTPTEETGAGPRPGFIAARPRSRSFSSAVAKAIGRRDLSINTHTPPLPSPPKRSAFGLEPSKATPPASPSAPSSPAIRTLHANNSTPSLSVPPSARSSSFSFASKTPKQSKTPKMISRMLPSPVSHKDYEDTINAAGLDFELVQPKKMSSAPQSPVSPQSLADDQTTIISSISTRMLPETDEWGFLKEKSTVPEIFASRAAPGEHRAMEQKWLSIISTPLPIGGPPKKVRKLASENGIPSSLRGKVWAWFMKPAMSARVAGLYAELCAHDRPSQYDEEIERDVETLWADHSIFHGSNAAGKSDLRSILRAYSNFAPSGYSTPMCLIAGTLLIHSVAEEAFWLLSGLVNTALKEYYVKDGPGMRIDAGVFEAVMRGSEKELFTAFKQAGVKVSDFVERWYKQLFIRCLPWPTTLRVMDAVVSEGSRFLFIAALTILTLSRDRILGLPRTKEAILGYLNDLPQDSLLLPDNFMRSCEKVRFREEDYKKLRASVEKEMGL